MFLKNRNISSKIKRSKVTDYAALRQGLLEIHVHGNSAVSGIVQAFLSASKEVTGAANSSICTSSVFVVDI